MAEETFVTARQATPAGTWFLPVEEFQDLYTPAYGSSWADATGNMLTDPVEAETLAVLVVEASEGKLRQPVLVHPGDPTDLEDGAPRILNGMHRTVACGIAGVPVPYRVAGAAELGGGTGDGTYVEVSLVYSLRADNGLSLAGTDGDDDRDRIHDLLRSFPVPGDLWADCGGSYSSGADGQLRFEACYDVPPGTEPDRYGQAVLSAALERISSHGLPAPASATFHPLDGEGEPLPPACEGGAR